MLFLSVSSAALREIIFYQTMERSDLIIRRWTFDVNIDGIVKSRNLRFVVIPVKTGIHKIQIVIDSRLRGNDTSGIFYEAINIT